VVKRPQPRVEFAVADGIDRFPAMTGNQPIEHRPDLEERHAHLLVSCKPQRRAFSERYPANRFVSLSFGTEEPLLFDANNVGQRRFAIFEIAPDPLCPRRRCRHSDHPRRPGL
jgi:hypothetical protein